MSNTKIVKAAEKLADKVELASFYSVEHGNKVGVNLESEINSIVNAVLDKRVARAAKKSKITTWKRPKASKPALINSIKT